MQRTSESIGTLAAALAKAQLQLTNPEKSLVATSARIALMDQNRPSAMRRSPAASTSCARRWATMRLRPCRRLPSTRPPASSI